MTPESILSGSKVLAEFEGWTVNMFDKHLFFKDGEEHRYDHEFTYHTSYDALMPVWVKFRDASKPEIIGFMGVVKGFTLSEYRGRITNALVYGTIEEAFTLLVEAVTWYNNQKGGQQ